VGRRGRDEVVAGDRDLVTDGQVVQPGNHPAGTTLDQGRRVGQLLCQGVGGVGAASAGATGPGKPHIGQRAEAVREPFDGGSQVRGT